MSEALEHNKKSYPLNSYSILISITLLLKDTNFSKPRQFTIPKL